MRPPGILATLAANMAQGWSHGPVGAIIAAWPAVSLVGSYELLVWIIRTATAGNLVRGPAADHCRPQAGRRGANLWPAAVQGPDTGPGNLIRHDTAFTPGGLNGLLAAPGMAGADQASGPDRNAADQAVQMTDQASGSPGPMIAAGSDVNAAAVAAYRAKRPGGQAAVRAQAGRAVRQTSRRWARNRMAEAQQSPAPA